MAECDPTLSQPMAEEIINSFYDEYEDRFKYLDLLMTRYVQA